jgi:hypothetical protein
VNSWELRTPPPLTFRAGRRWRRMVVEDLVAERKNDAGGTRR